MSYFLYFIGNVFIHCAQYTRITHTPLNVRLAFRFPLFILLKLGRNFIDVIWINSVFWAHLQFSYRYIDTLKAFRNGRKKQCVYPKRINIIIDMFYQQNLIYFMILMPMWRILFDYVFFSFVCCLVCVLAQQ